MEEILKLFDLTTRDGQMILIGSAVFYAFWWIVDVVVFKPFLKVYEEREALTTGASSSSKEILDEAFAINKRCEDQIHSARVSVMTEKYQALNDAKKQASIIITDAENEVQELVRKVRWDRESAMSTTRAQVMSDADALAKTIADRLKQPTASSAARN